MSGQGVWAGLSGSAFLAGVDARDREPWRIGASIVGGGLIGFVAATATALLVMIGFVFATGHAAEGLKGLDVARNVLTASAPANLAGALLNLGMAVANLPFALGLVAVAAVFSRHALLDYVTAARRIRWRLMAAGLILAAIALGPLVASQLVFSPQTANPPIVALTPDLAGRAVYLIAVIGALIVAAAAEELVFRGWLLRQTSALLRQPGPLIGLTALAFAAMHLDFNPDAFLTRALMGAGFAYMALRLGGIEFSTGVHAANNILIVLFIEPLSAQTVNAPSTFSAGSLVVDVSLIVIYVAITEAVARAPILRRWSGVRLEELSGWTPTVPRFS